MSLSVLVLLLFNNLPVWYQLKKYFIIYGSESPPPAYRVSLILSLYNAYSLTTKTTFWAFPLT